MPLAAVAEPADGHPAQQTRPLADDDAFDAELEAADAREQSRLAKASAAGLAHANGLPRCRTQAHPTPANPPGNHPMSYYENEVEPRIYARQAENAPPWSPHLKTIGQMIADTQSLLDSIDAKATAADVIRVVEILVARLDRSKLDLTRAWNSSSAEEQAWLRDVIAGEVE
jgi:hypothetical protein